MNWANLVDTVLNVVVFAFIGLLLRLYLRDEGPSDESGNSRLQDSR